jgi:arylsulfatase A-like enzyme
MKIGLVVLDATRTDFLGPYGGEDDATPTVDNLAEKGLVFTDCIAGAPWTPASHATMFTGRYPSAHDVRADDLSFPENGHYLPEALSDAGIRTQGIGAEPWLARRQGVHRGFERFHDGSKVTENLHEAGHHTPGDLPTLFRAGAGYGTEPLRSRLGTDRDAARFGVFLFREWLRRADSFTFMNISVAHGPYDPPQVFRDRLDVSVTSDDPYLDHQSIHPYIVGHETPSEEAWADIRQLYAAGVAHADYLLGRAIERMDDDTWLIVTADHGDNLGENRRAGHQFSLADDLINVPLIISHPSLTAGRRDDLVSHVDLAPTVYDILDREGFDVPGVPADLPGRSLLDGPGPEGRVVFAEYGPPAPHINALLNRTDKKVDPETLDTLFRGIQAAVTGDFKLLRYTDGETVLYRRGDETEDMSDDQSGVVETLLAAMDEELGPMKDIDLSEMDAYVEAGVEDRLEALGYL